MSGERDAMGGTAAVGSGGPADAAGGGIGTAGVGTGGPDGSSGDGQADCGDFTSAPGTCPSLCGNGVRDMCLAPTSSSCPTVVWTESCDGTDLGTDSCSQRGYAGGILTCTATCAVDDSACTECFPIDATLVHCGPAPTGLANPGSVVVSFAVAATDAEVGLAVLSRDDKDNTTVSFARLSPTLDPISFTVVEDHLPPNADGAAAFADLAAAPLPVGWVLAMSGPLDLELHAMGGDGSAIGRTVVDPAPVGDAPQLAARSTGGPLLLWGGATIRTSLIAADGKSATAPVDIPITGLQGRSQPTAAFVGDSFYVAFRGTLLPPEDKDVLRVVNVGLDGTIANAIDLLPGERVSPSNLASDANDLRLAYGGTPSAGDGDPVVTMWQRLSVDGATLGGPTTFLLEPPFFVGPSFGFGDDTVVLARGLYTRSITFTRIGKDGSILTPPHQISRAPAFEYGAARRGPDIVIVWLGSRGLQIARVTP